MEAVKQVVTIRENDVTFSVLPLHHTYEAIAFLMMISSGAAISFCEGFRRLRENLKEYRPTIFVPTQQATCDLHDEILRRRDAEYNALGPDFNAPVPYEWFDFQPASRIIQGLYAMYFVKNMDVVTDVEWQILEDFVFTHGQNIFWAEESHIKLHPSNHQALRGMALLTACAFFKGTRGTEKWLPVAEKMCDYHIRMDFLADGMLNDLSPSYHFFESWITRDALKIAAHMAG